MKKTLILICTFAAAPALAHPHFGSHADDTTNLPLLAGGVLILTSVIVIGLKRKVRE